MSDIEFVGLIKQQFQSSAVAFYGGFPAQRRKFGILLSSKVSDQMKFGMKWTYIGAIYNIPQMTGYLTRISFNCQTK
jgi:hypothetical protein